MSDSAESTLHDAAHHSALQTQRLAAAIDHTLLKPEAPREAILTLCSEATSVTTASVCVNPVWVRTAAAALTDTPVKVCTVVGFPLGATTTTAKVAETRQAIAEGATEIDMVIHSAAATGGDADALVTEISAVVQAAQNAQDAEPSPEHAAEDAVLVKVIIEASLLDDDAKVLACQAAQQAGADFVKTSTGFVGGGATVDDVRLMRATVGETMGVKASGGIRDRATAIEMLDAGASRLGASATLAILDDNNALKQSESAPLRGTR